VSEPGSTQCATSIEAGSVRGERGAALVSAARSLQSRAGSVLAATLTIALGVAALSWYYAHAFSHRGGAVPGTQPDARARAQGEMALPALGPIPRPQVPPAVAPSEASLPPALPPEVPLLPAGPNSAGAPPVKTPAELAFERRLSGAVFARAGEGAAGPPGGPVVPDAASGTTGPPAAAPPPTALSGLLMPTAASATQARRTRDPHFLLPQGAFLDCTLETAIDSTLPGMTTCISATDTFSADGKVVLLERGTKLVGETRGQVQQGQARLFVLWTQARTPGGVIVPLDSPGTDELGRAGVSGEVQRHFWERFGAGILVSVINGAVQAGVQAASSSHGTVIYAPGASSDVLTEVLRETMQIPPTITKDNGDRIQVLVARDVDFRSVYELRAAAGG
jgi:type IV secretion system protein VirB10